MPSSEKPLMYNKIKISSASLAYLDEMGQKL